MDNNSNRTVEWIRSREAVSLLTSWGSGFSLRPEGRLRDGLRNGLVSARARVANLTPQSGGRSIQETDFEVPIRCWTGDDANCRFNLRDDKFTSRDTRSGYSHAFNKEQLIEFADIADARAPSTEAAARGGRTPDAEKWANFSAAMLGYAHEEGIDPQWSAGQLYDAVADYAMERAKDVPHKSNVGKALSLALRWAKGIDSPAKED
jgi:hypothetical protein